MRECETKIYIGAEKDLGRFWWRCWCGKTEKCGNIEDGIKKTEEHIRVIHNNSKPPKIISQREVTYDPPIELSGLL